VEYPGLIYHVMSRGEAQRSAALCVVKKSNVILLSLALAIGLAISVVWTMSPDEPAYQGVPLSSWLADLAADNGDPRALAAVQAMDTNAVPHLVRAIAGWHHRRWKDRLHAIGSTLPGTGRRVQDPANDRYCGAIFAFKALGPKATNAVPQLRKLLGSQNGDGAARALAHIGPAALPALADAVTNASPAVRYHGLLGVSLLETNGGPALPAVVKCLHDTNIAFGTQIRWTAILALGEMRDAGRAAVPVLTELLDDPDPAVHTLATQSLNYLGSDTNRE
jgi:PBS lyase HEAT-like repeat